MGIAPRFEPGGLGQFDVLVDGEVIASRGGGFWSRMLGIGGWPDEAEVVRAIAGRLNTSR